eukprot:12411360-Prorocentrum_lima.AAC.1
MRRRLWVACNLLASAGLTETFTIGKKARPTRLHMCSCAVHQMQSCVCFCGEEGHAKPNVVAHVHAQEVHHPVSYTHLRAHETRRHL